MVVFGVDLGTTNSAMAYIDAPKRTIRIKNDEENLISSSVVQFTDKKAIIGEAVKNSITVKKMVMSVKYGICVIKYGY